jgi:hypothetical protein
LEEKQLDTIFIQISLSYFYDFVGFDGDTPLHLFLKYGKSTIKNTSGGNLQNYQNSILKRLIENLPSYTWEY